MINWLVEGLIVVAARNLMFPMASLSLEEWKKVEHIGMAAVSVSLKMD